MQVINSRDVPHISQRATVVPAVGDTYRRRGDGQPAVCHAARGMAVVLDLGWRYLTLSVGEFWNRWIHADLYDPTRN